MKKYLSGLVCGLVILAADTLWATTLVNIQYSFNGAELFDYVVGNGVDGSTAAENNIFDGARLFKVWDETTSSYTQQYASYRTSSSADFLAWTRSGDRLVDISLWGYGGNGANWGEDYKVQKWVNANATDANWHPYNEPWPWANPPANNSGILQEWWASDSSGQFYSYDSGMGFDQNGYGDFSFTLSLDLDDPSFSGNSPWFNGERGNMVFWFGAWAMNGAGEWTGYYEGNIVLSGRFKDPVPEPATMLLFGAGLAAFGITRKRNRKEG